VTDLNLVVARTETIAPGVRQVTLVPRDPAVPLPSYPPGSHLGLRWRPDRVNFYSLTGDGRSPGTYTVSVLRVADSRGGSEWVHQLEPGDQVTAVPPRSTFAPVATARNHLLVAGGIGITPLLSHARWHVRWGNEFSLYYVHRRGRAAHLDEVTRIGDEDRGDGEQGTGAGGRRAWAFGNRGDFWSCLGPALGRQPLGTYLYACGPLGMTDAVTDAARTLGWPQSRIRVEAFGAADEGPRDPFTVTLTESGRRVNVGAGETLLEALERSGAGVDSMCRQGVCGECRTPLARGRADHRDLVLPPGERDDWIMPCVSRAADDDGLELRL
jgi:ferredoxin-NADP reductase